MAVAQRMPFRLIDAARLQEMLGSRHSVVFDVRDDEAYTAGHIAGALHLPLGSSFEDELTQTVSQHTHPLVFTDEGRGQAQDAAQRALALGYEDVHVYVGGLQQWTRAGGRLESGVRIAQDQF